MSYGLEVWDAEGNKALSITDRLTRVFGKGNTGYSAGQIVDNKLLTGNPFFAIVGNVQYSGLYDHYPVFSFSGNALSWTFIGGGGPVTPVSVDFIWGVY